MTKKRLLWMFLLAPIALICIAMGLLADFCIVMFNIGRELHEKFEVWIDNGGKEEFEDE